MQSEQPRRRKIRLLTRLAEADKQIGKLRLLKTEMMHRLAEAEFRLLLRRPASSWETFILFFYLVLEVATSIRYPRMNVPRALFLRLGSRV